MKKIISTLLLVPVAAFSFAQDIDRIINAAEVRRIETVLSSDDMEGRATFTRGNNKAAAFIAEEFRKAGIKTLNNSDSYLQPFSMISAKPESVSVTADGAAVDSRNVALITTQPSLQVNDQSGYEQVVIRAGADFRNEAGKYLSPKSNYVVWLDPSFSGMLPRLGQRGASFKSPYTTIFILGTKPAHFSVNATMQLTESRTQNVVGMIPGKSKPDEYVIFSGHYDHLGIRSKDRDGRPLADSIYNGANDDAAGTTAVIMLAKYFRKLHNNERTLIFAAFTGEEVGGYGSRYFSNQFNPDQVKAMFNIEMIGTESKWGTNSAYITGYERTDMGKILQKNLEGTGFTFYPDPYVKEQLFFRSDNATLARLGVPAHTISTSKMDNEPNYHKASDEIGTLDMDNMAKIIKAVALSSRGIIAGTETPSRVDVDNLKR